jgi:hypothetical protein
MESEGGFGALILVYTVLMQRVSTPTRARIVKWLTEIVAIEKPVKATARSPVPACIPSQRVRFHAGSNHGVGFQRVLIKMSARGTASPEPIAADRREMPRFSLLLLYQPTERPQPNVDNLPSGSPVPAEDVAWESFALSYATTGSNHTQSSDEFIRNKSTKRLVKTSRS